ncbi:hypothetical protein M885DRAFT_432104 [Pelagophyceae sp. CCMP2097]|nr:hypothetical protein M885DRAFT_432104 [Pelagophyceae sp. CCMP2097]
MAKSWGVRTDLARGTFQAPLHALPELFRPLVDRMRATVACLKDFRPNEANAIDYQRERGDFLAAHCDHRQLSGKVLVNLCLAGAATMTYQRDKAPPHEFRVRLGRRALQVQSGCVRYDFSHGIAHADLHDERRVSVTFRQDRDADANSQHCM